MPQTFEIVSPVDGSVLARRSYASRPEIEAAVERARTVQAEWAHVSLDDRAALLRAVVSELRKQASDLAREVAWQMGRPLFQADETGRLELVLDILIDEAKKALQPIAYPSGDDVMRYVKRMPVGVCLSICAWNYPVAMTDSLIFAPLLAGNAVIFKHAPQTALVGERFADAFRAAGAPAGLFQNLNMRHEDADRVVASGAVNAVKFIGSTRGGLDVHRAAAGTLAHVGLELGGNDATYVRPDANLDVAIPDLVEGCFGNAGQSCCSVERIYVHAAIYDQFTDHFIAAASEWRMGHPIEESPHIGPLVSAAAAERVRGLVSEALEKGARQGLPTQGAPRVADSSAYLSPQVLIGANHEMDVMRKEVFGPVAPLMRVVSDEEAVQLMNRTDYGLTASIWSADVEAAARMGDQIEVGTFYVNRCDHADLYLPWGGVKQSGIGRIHGGSFGYDQFTEPHAFHVRRV
jgi:acyl-CoA reductase-like NAD-dependent aldehyde dehydrogenase